MGCMEVVMLLVPLRFHCLTHEGKCVCEGLGASLVPVVQGLWGPCGVTGLR